MPVASRHPLALILVFLLGNASLTLPHGLWAQTSADAVFRGRVVDERGGQAVAGVLLRIDSGAEAVSDEDGRFRLVGLEAGDHLYALLTADCKVTWGQVELAPGVVTEETVMVASAFASSQDAEEADTERRRAKGKFVTGDEIAQMNALSLAEVIRRVAPSMVRGDREEAGGATGFTSRGQNSIVSLSEPVVVIDGVRMPDASIALQNIRPSEVETLEILPGAAGGWECGSSGSGGVIRVTTGRRSSAAGPAPKRCVVPSFPGR